MIVEKGGRIIKGIWVNDKLNGLASVENFEGQDKRYVIFKDGMEIHLTKEPLRTGSIMFSVLIMLAFYSGIALGIIVDSVYFFILFVTMVYICYVCCCNETCKYLSNLLELKTVFLNIGTAIASPPTINWHISCYHYRYSRDSKGRRKKHRVNTHRASYQFQTPLFKDQSPDPSNLHYLDMLKLSRFHTDKIINFTPEALKRYTAEKNNFFSFNKRDRY